MRAQLLSWGFAAFSLATIYVIYRAAIYSAQALAPQRCRMSWMFPEYKLQAGFNKSWSPLAGRYSLWLYREGDGWDTSRELTGTPAIFIPGNAGSSHQARSIASSAARQYFSDRNGFISPEFANRGLKPIDFFTVEFNEDFSALHGPTLVSQRGYILAAIDYILSLYPSDTRIFVVGHSMGGIAAVSLLPHPMISGIITLSSPHSLPPARYSAEMEEIYDAVYVNLSAENATTPVISICGGAADFMVPSETCRLPSSSHSTQRHLTVFTTGLEGCWSAVGHQVSVWCHQVRWRVARAILEVDPFKSDGQNFAVMTKWFRDQRQLEANLMPDLPDFTPQWEQISDNQVLAMDQISAGTRAFLIPKPINLDTFVLCLSGGTVAGRAPHRTSHNRAFVFYCRKAAGDSTRPFCVPASNFSAFVLPGHNFGHHLSPNHDGADEADGIVWFETDVSRDEDIDSIGVVVRIEQPSDRTKLLAAFSRKKIIEHHGGLIALLLEGISVQMPHRAPHTQLRLPNLPLSALFVYRVETSLFGSCNDALITPILSIASDDEQLYYSALSSVHLIHSHRGGPFIQLQGRHLSVDIYSTGTCDIQALTIQLDIFASLGRWGLRYFGAVAVWSISIVLIILARSWETWRREGTFPTIEESLCTFLGRDVQPLMLILLFGSLLPFPKSALLGNGGAWAFAPLAPLIFAVSCGSVAFSVTLMNGSIWLWRSVLLMISPRRTLSFEPRPLRRSIAQVVTVLAATVIFIPYQVVFVVCCAVQYVTCVSWTDRQPTTKSGTSSEYNLCIHILLSFFWLLPNMLPALAVWIRTIATTGSVSLFGSDHSPFPIIPILILVEIYSASSKRALLPESGERTPAFLTVIVIWASAVAPLIIGPRYPYYAFNACCLVYLVLLVQHFEHVNRTK